MPSAKDLPPVERWNPAYCGEIDMRIAADGTWHYMGTPINRPALVKLFSTVLRKDPERHVLVTPVERVGIEVEDAPFLAVEMAVEGEGEEPPDRLSHQCGRSRPGRAGASRCASSRMRRAASNLTSGSGASCGRA